MADEVNWDKVVFPDEPDPPKAKSTGTSWGSVGKDVAPLLSTGFVQHPPGDNRCPEQLFLDELLRFGRAHR